VRRSVVALGVAVVAAAVDAHAARRIAILGFSGEGVSSDVRAQFETLIEEGLRKKGYGVVTRAAALEVLTRRELPDSCTFGPCVALIGEALGVERVLDARISADGQSYSFVLSLVEARHGSPIDQVVGSCPVCTVSEALGRVGAGIEALEKRPAAQSAPVAMHNDVQRLEPRRKTSKLWPAILVGVGLAAVGGGALLTSQTTHDAPGWVTIGSGGTVTLTGLIWLLVGD
jgi:hypothetical protein